MKTPSPFRAAFALLSVASAVALAAACGSSPQKKLAPDSPAAAASPGAADGGVAAAPLPPPEYAYSPVGKRDPFRSPLEDLLKREQTGSGRDCGPLCRWEIEQLKLVGVISGLPNPLAMVEDPKGKGYVIRRGTFIGKNNGKVTQIKRDEVVITEIFKDHLGKPHANPLSMKLPKEAGPGVGADEDQNFQTEGNAD